MFFRRERPKPILFEDRIQALQRLGFTAGAAGARTRVERDGCAAVIEAGAGGKALVVERPGRMMGNEIGGLVDGGFQKFFQTPSGRRKPALAEELKALHNFSEDLREGLGLVSLYNEALGTTSKLYLYDRVEDRDKGVKRIWEAS
jgi:hypothetical protein